MKNVAVTGGRGFIGSHLVDHLASKGFSPVIIDNLANSSKSWKGFEKYTFYNVDVRKIDLV